MTRSKNRKLDFRPSARVMVFGLILALIIAGCREDDDGPGLRLTSDSDWLYADGRSWTRIEISSPTGAPPRVRPSEGSITSLSPLAPHRWQAYLGGGTRPGRVSFDAAGGRVREERPIYFIPPPDPMTPRPCARDTLGRYTITVDRDAELATVDYSDEDNDLGGAVDVYLYPGLPPAFIGDTVELTVVVEGSGLSHDLVDLILFVDQVSGGALAGTEDTTGGVGFDLGDFPATNAAIRDEGAPAIWGAKLIIKADSDALVITGRVTAASPCPAENAGFRIRPFLTRFTGDAIDVRWETDRESPGFAAFGGPGCRRVAGGRVSRHRIYDSYDWSFPRRFTAFFYAATLDGLGVGTTAWYSVPAVVEPAGPERFRFGRRPGQTFTFGVIGDTQSDCFSEEEAHGRLSEMMGVERFDFTLHVGDLVQHSNLDSLWRKFFRLQDPLNRGAAFFPTPGNHDLQQFDLFFNRYFSSGRWRSLDWGNSHFIFIDSYLEVSPDSPQHQWLAADLAATELRPEINFTFVVMHNPIWTVFKDRQFLEGHYLEDLFERYRVDAVFAGHIHVYERSDVNGRIYIDSSGGGAEPREFPMDPGLNPHYVRHEAVHHYLRVTVEADRFTVQAVDSDGVVFDEVSRTAD